MANLASNSLSSSSFNWTYLALVVSILIGASLFVVPIQWTVLAIVLLLGVIYLVFNPIKSYYLMILTIPFLDRIRGLTSIAFTPNDIFIFICTAQFLVSYFSDVKRVSLKTPFDKGLLAVLGVYVFASIFTEKEYSIWPFLKFMEAFMMYYLTVYYIRSKRLTRVDILKAVWFTGLYQALFGILQSLTGSLGTDYSSQRGYLGYLGLGSSTVWHGVGTMIHFNELGSFLTTNFLLFIPFYFMQSGRKWQTKVLMGIYLLGIMTTYSRGALLALMLAGIFYVSHTQKTYAKATWITLGIVFFVILPPVLFLSNSSYVDTLHFIARLNIWQIPLAVITQNWKTFWLGSGLDSYEYVATPYIPGNVLPEDYRYWFAHNFYLLVTLEFGLIGAAIVFGLVLKLFKTVRDWFINAHGLVRIYSLSMCLYCTAFLSFCMFDHSYFFANLKVYLFILLAITGSLNFRKPLPLGVD